jgi:ribosomal protein S18 acetylase RimI-like enzyme
MNAEKFGNNIQIRKANISDIQEIHETLSESFEPYKQHYTEEAHKATVISPTEIEKRLTDQKSVVLLAVYNNKIVGTASIKIEQNGNFYLRSMGVKPNYQGLGIGICILEEINRIAKKEDCKVISLECYEPLKKATRLYEKFGFRRTGRKRDYHGLIVFEMIKEINQQSHAD